MVARPRRNKVKLIKSLRIPSQPRGWGRTLFSFLLLDHFFCVICWVDVKHSRFLSVQASLGPYGKVRSWSSSLRQALLSLLLLTQSFVD